MCTQHQKQKQDRKSYENVFKKEKKMGECLNFYRNNVNRKAVRWKGKEENSEIKKKTFTIWK